MARPSQLSLWFIYWIVRPPLFLIGFLLKPVYALLFDRLDRRLAMQHQEQFAIEIQDAMPFLFAEHRGVIVPNRGVPFPPGFDGAYVTVELHDVSLVFVRGRGDCGVRITPKSNSSQPWNRFDATDHLTAEELRTWTNPKDLWDLARVLETKLQSIRQRYAGDDKL